LARVARQCKMYYMEFVWCALFHGVVGIPMPINSAVTRCIASRVANWAVALMERRAPDFVIGHKSDPYLRRWWVIPRNPIANVYLHDFRKDDDDRACHCHPWISLSLALKGKMLERYLDRSGGIVVEREREVVPGDVLYRRSVFAHRMIVTEPGSLTLFITGPRIREWGFWCGGRRFVPWQEFVDDRDRGLVGKGCE
jgi:hypothetical protein